MFDGRANTIIEIRLPQEARKVACDNTVISWPQPGHQTYCYFSTQGQGGCTGFLVSMFISHLLLIKKINKQMSSYQILRVFLQFLGKYTTANLSLNMHCIFLFFIGQKHIYFLNKYWSHSFQDQLIGLKKG